MPKRLPYFYEIYTKHPNTGERGWDIQVGYVTGAPDRAGAERVLRKVYGPRLFDTVIQLYTVGDVEPIYADFYNVIPYGNPRNWKQHTGKRFS